MIPASCLAIETRKFPVLEGEKDEIVNENMYGKALCKYLEQVLPKAGLKVPAYGPEDWGWWLDVEDEGFSMGLCIYSDPGVATDPERYAILPSVREAKKWSWSRFRTVDVSANVLKIISAVESMLKADSDIAAVTRHDDFPFSYGAHGGA